MLEPSCLLVPVIAQVLHAKDMRRMHFCILAGHEMLESLNEATMPGVKYSPCIVWICEPGRETLFILSPALADMSEASLILMLGLYQIGFKAV